MRSKAQVTIFIIVAILLVAAVALFLLLRGGGVIPSTGADIAANPDAFLKGCMEDKIEESLSLLSEQGGYISPELAINFKFEDEKDFVNISYLCYYQNNYLPCINQEPMLVQHLKSEIKNHISENVGNCFGELRKSLEDKGYEVEASYRGFEVDLVPKNVLVNIDGEMTYSRTGSINKEKDFGIAIFSDFYEVVVVAQEIVSQEARFCNNEHVGYMLLYPEFNIDKFRTGESTTIYRVEHRKSKDKFKFAVRGCVIPPGF